MLIQDGFALCVVNCHLPGQGVKVGVTRRMDPMEVLGNLYECSIVFSDIQHGTTLQYRKGIHGIYGYMQIIITNTI